MATTTQYSISPSDGWVEVASSLLSDDVRIKSNSVGTWYVYATSGANPSPTAIGETYHGGVLWEILNINGSVFVRTENNNHNFGVTT